MSEPIGAVGDQRTDSEEGMAEKPVPSLPARLLQSFVSPGRMVETVAENPRFLGAMIVCAILLALSVGLLPYELFEEMQRRMVIQSGRAVQEMPERARDIIRIVTIASAGVGFVIMSFVGAGITTFIFAFVLGDEGKYRQYLAVGVHAAVIPTAIALALAPMRIAAGDPQLTINLSTFLFFLPDGFVYNLFRALDVSRIWAALVVAMGIHAIDKRRSFASAASIQLGILLLFALVGAWFLTSRGL